MNQAHEVRVREVQQVAAAAAGSFQSYGAARLVESTHPCGIWGIYRADMATCETIGS